MILVPLLIVLAITFAVGLLFGRLLERDARRRLGAPVPLPLAIARLQRQQRADLVRELVRDAIRRRV